MTLTRLAHTIVLAWGWRRVLIAFLAGAATTLALPPTDVWPVPFITFPILVWLVDGAAAGRLGGVVAAATAGWWFGFGYFLAGLYWVGNAFLVDAKTFGWLLPFAVIGLPGRHGDLHRTGTCAGAADLDAGRRPACWRSRSRSPSRNGCAAICSADFPGTPTAMRWSRRSGSRRARR